MGKWEVYKTFCLDYSNNHSKLEGGFVFGAFAKHLKNRLNPIYDQHALRALWAICDLSDNEKDNCSAFLFDGSGKWKEVGSGGVAGSCYELFMKHVGHLCSNNRISNAELDRVLMPLGQARKKSTKNGNATKSSQSESDRFFALCWSARVHASPVT